MKTDLMMMVAGLRGGNTQESNGRHPAVHTPRGRLLACKKTGEALWVVSCLRPLSRGGWLGFDAVMVTNKCFG